MNHFTLNPMPNFGFDSVTMGYNSMTNNINNSMVNNLVVDDSTSNDLMDITTMTQSLIIKDSGVDDLMAVDDMMVDGSATNSLMDNHSAYPHSTNSSTIGSPTTDTPLDMGDSIDTPMVDSPITNGSTTSIFPGGNAHGKDSMGSTANPPMAKSLVGRETVVDSSAAPTGAKSILNPRLRKSLWDQMLFVDGPRKGEGVWLCAQCIKHLDRDGNDDLRKWHIRYGIRPGLNMHPEARVKRLRSSSNNNILASSSGAARRHLPSATPVEAIIGLGDQLYEELKQTASDEAFEGIGLDEWPKEWHPNNRTGDLGASHPNPNSGRCVVHKDRGVASVLTLFIIATVV
ncbi:uncharacterized protein NECHADRAFT_79632 [Fusarium vanettenii 77-13-4]|uniref:Uncharacterized protein n=1 Tax=Fusarium vanettenii (strain ATCC MYA-4622 / CBS 123669 / FGSC 9596 / NRRL 45880 / 77-13-4) TaxID=660122 RepID=C7Z817_FUSV7|nr:uncharacterized protein NECHADRAFT_79632 [Fusarium vanettenii 77-13-4]EEU39788.1 predicted protein [Fusarium vanettenii 77-13-4]